MYYKLDFQKTLHECRICFGGWISYDDGIFPQTVDVRKHD